MRRRKINIAPSTMQQIYDTTKITPEEISFLFDELRQTKKDGEEISYILASVILHQRYDRHKEEDKHKAFVILQRMDCLMNLMGDERMHGWIKGEEDGGMLADHAILRATALCRICRRNGQAYFKPDEFFDLVLSESQPHIDAVV